MARQKHPKSSLRPPKQPPHPIISFKISPHGVSGDPVIGVPGAFNTGFSTPGIHSGNLAPSASRYGIQAGGNTITIKYGNNTYNQTTPVRLPSINTESAFTAEPVWESRLARGASAPTTLPLNQILQSGGAQHMTTYLAERARMGLFGDDMYLQSIMPTLDGDHIPARQVGDVVTPVRPIRLQFNSRPTTAIRTGDQPSGSTNNEAQVPVQTPDGQSTLHDINDAHTPQRTTVGYSAPGTHPAHGPSPSQNYDGSWTIDVLPGGQQQPGLQDLPPAADIPVQTYTGDGPRNTSIHFTRPSGGRNVQMQTKAVAVFS
jgi:hypothetical protein